MNLRPHLLALSSFLTLAAVACVATGPATAQSPRPCEDDPLHRQLDFWAGDWAVVGSDGERMGTNRVRSLHGGCVIEESWSAERGGYSGQSLNYVDPRDGRWKQTWVDSTGSLVLYDGELRGGAMRFEGENLRLDGTRILARVVLEPLGEDRLRHRIEHSDDDGETWRVVFDGTYVPLGEEEVAERMAETRASEERPETPAPAPEAPAPPPVAEEPDDDPEAETAPGAVPGGVRAVSVTKADEELPVEERPRVQLASPMVLEVPVGPIESIPEEYSWSTQDTAQYVSEGVTVRRVTLSRDERGGAVDVEVIAGLYGSNMLDWADLTAELMADGEVVASGTVENFPVGRSLQAQNQGAGLEKALTLTLDRSRFAQIFAGEERPVLRLTVTVRD